MERFQNYFNDLSVQFFDYSELLLLATERDDLVFLFLFGHNMADTFTLTFNDYWYPNFTINFHNNPIR